MMYRGLPIVVAVFAISICLHAGTQGASSVAGRCVDCHSKTTPNVVADWRQSRHSQAGIGCDAFIPSVIAIGW
jgi:hypothetical protein